MTQTSYFVRLALYFIGLMIVINLVSILFGLALKHVDGILLVVLVGNQAAKYIVANGNELSSREYWALFFGSLGVYSFYNILLLLYLSFLIVLTPDMIILTISMVLALGAFATFLGLWSAKRSALKSITKPVAVKACSVTDEGIANYLIDELSKHQINAFVDKFQMQHDPLLSTAPSAEVNIMLHDDSDLNKARDIITTFFEEQENSEPWVCPKCQEKNEGSFSICWNCGYEN